MFQAPSTYGEAIDKNEMIPDKKSILFGETRNIFKTFDDNPFASSFHLLFLQNQFFRPSNDKILFTQLLKTQ